MIEKTKHRMNLTSYVRHEVFAPLQEEDEADMEMYKVLR